MACFLLSNVLDQTPGLNWGWLGIWLKVLREKRKAILVDYLADRLVGQVDRG